ncbi:hypothetical protein [Pseudonocardia acaciae]|uniref:hypothetical protein n=1 Tax=Pseudonocardia acaciae TaxID=551276 RepID=UPI000685EC05|nr:hypothetical protein [Pseudonocardia acaciae]
MVKIIDPSKLRKKFLDPKSWPFALMIALLLGLVVLIDKGSLSSESGLSAPCRVEVSADVLTVHSTPDSTGTIVATLHRGDLRGAQTTVRNGYRQLGDNNWALDQALRPLPGSKCS